LLLLGVEPRLKVTAWVLLPEESRTWGIGIEHKKASSAIHR